MKVLWLSPNCGKYNNDKTKGTGGWIGALQDAIKQYIPEITLGIAYIGSDDSCDSLDGVDYFSINSHTSNRLLDRIKNIEGDKGYFDEIYATKIRKIISKYEPDIVHIWGTEHPLISILPYLEKPHVVHIQGLTSLYSYTYLPPFISLSDIKNIDSWWSPFTWKKLILHNRQIDLYHDFKYKGEREMSMSRYVKNWIGRTEWDYNASQMLNPGSRYFHCEEVMRPDFDKDRWVYHYNGSKIIIHSSINDTWYKGIDVILKTAQVLKKTSFDFIWNVYGIPQGSMILDWFENKLNVRSNDVNVCLHGRVSADVIKQGLIDCDVYVHPSYIENSSNAIAEAMMLGVPTIAQYTGGNPSMLKDNSGVLVAVNEPVILAKRIIDMTDEKYATTYSMNAHNLAIKRQNPMNTATKLHSIYNEILNDQKV